jgi:hypothetical protein
MTGKPEVLPATTTVSEGKLGRLEAHLLELAKTPEDRERAYKLIAHAQQQDLVRRVAVAIAEQSWGREISPVARAAVARYCLEIGADPVRHVFVLAGNIYLNAAFWMDLVAANPKFRRDEVDFIHDDERANSDERARRKALRVTYAVPEGAPGVAVVTLHYEGRGPFIGVNWAGARTNDPVGKAEPTKTAQSRAYRKAAMKAEPAWFKGHPVLEAAEAVVTWAHEIDKAGERPPTVPPIPTDGALALAPPDEGDV